MPFPPFSFFKGKNVLLLAHSGADVDALAAAAALFFVLRGKCRAKVAAIDHANLLAKTFAKNVQLPYEINPSLQGFDAVVAVDFNSFEIAGGMSEDLAAFRGKIFVLDHHVKGKKPLAPAKSALIDEKAIAACELVFDLLEKNKIALDKKIASCIAAGILTDSNNLALGSAKMLDALSQCLKVAGKTLPEARALFRVKKDFSEKIATLKAAKRIRIFKLGNYVAVTTDIGAFEAEAAETLIADGADLAFAGDLDKGVLRISGRASHEILKQTKLDLAEHVFQPLGNFFEGMGGGHAGAAAFNGKTSDLQAALQKCLELAAEFLRKKNPSISLEEYTS